MKEIIQWDFYQTDSDPKCKYIATQGPIPNTTNAFWQMVWEQGSCVIVALTRPSIQTDIVFFFLL